MTVTIERDDVQTAGVAPAPVAVETIVADGQIVAVDQAGGRVVAPAAVTSSRRSGGRTTRH
jgi:hypothetical protein